MTEEGLSTAELIDQRAAHLTAYQDQALADRYRAEVAAIAAAGAGMGAPDLERIVARTLARVLAYKVEYEVARLYSAPAFLQHLAEPFDCTPSLSL